MGQARAQFPGLTNPLNHADDVQSHAGALVDNLRSTGLVPRLKPHRPRCGPKMPQNSACGTETSRTHILRVSKRHIERQKWRCT